MKLLRFLILILFCTGGTVAYSQSFQQQTDEGSHTLPFEIFPNPLKNGLLTLKLQAAGTKTIFIYDLLGNLVYQVKTQEEQLDLRFLTTGIYIFKVQQDQKTGLKRLVVH